MTKSTDHGISVPHALAGEICHRLYGIDGKATLLPGEFDYNYCLTTVSGERFVLKVMREACDSELIDLQVSALAHLVSRLPEGSVPRVIPTLSAEMTAHVTDTAGALRWVWMLSYLPGRLLGELEYHPPDLLHGLGGLLAELDIALEGFSHPGADRPHRWNMMDVDWVREDLRYIEGSARRALIETVLGRFQKEVSPRGAELRKAIIHGDANDLNVVVRHARSGGWDGIGIVDFGDMVASYVAAEPAIAAAYAMFDKANPLAAAASVVAGYHAGRPLTQVEISVLPCMIAMRLAVSVTNAARRKMESDDPYITVSEHGAWTALEYLDGLNPRLVHYTLRSACGFDVSPERSRVVEWLQQRARQHAIAPVLDVDLQDGDCAVLDLGAGSLLLGADPAALTTDRSTEIVFGEVKRLGVSVGVGRYLEARAWYDAPAFRGTGNPLVERRTVHLGIDLFVQAGSRVHAPLDGVIHTVNNNAISKDYGPLVILRHEIEKGDEFFTLYGHLAWDSVRHLTVGDVIAAGDVLGCIGSAPENGDWAPHLHLQIITDLLGLDNDFPGVARASELAVWQSLSPDPNVLLGIPGGKFPSPARSTEHLLADREVFIGHNLSVFYERPIKIVRGWMQYLYDDTARQYLDLYNNVAHVGHSHPHVVHAIQRQVGLLNTNSRYLHDNLTEYAERLLAHLPAELNVCYFVNSGTEANELALRLARANTNREDVIVLASAYHGHTNTLIDISPYKFEGPGGAGKRPWVHVAPLPDLYRGRYRHDDPDAGGKYANDVLHVIDAMRIDGGQPAAFIAESAPSVGGQIVFPAGYLEDVYQYVRDAGGICIADEVHVGFGRLGTHFWGFESQGVVPDIVVLGKPIGNGHPLGAVITTRDIARAFDNGMEFFSTFGGNPVSCATGIAVLDVLEGEGLQERALALGAVLMEGLEELKVVCSLVGDVRGSGLFVGVELVLDRSTLEPATDAARFVANRLRELGVLTGTDGPFNNVLKIRPPMVIAKSDIGDALALLEQALREADSWR